MSDVYAELRDAADALKRVIDARRASLAREIEDYGSAYTSEQMLDAAGRPILGDLLAAYCNALAALANQRPVGIITIDSQGEATPELLAAIRRAFRRRDLP